MYMYIGCQYYREIVCVKQIAMSNFLITSLALNEFGMSCNNRAMDKIILCMLLQMLLLLGLVH